MDKNFTTELIKKRIDDDLFWLPSIAIHMLENDDIYGAYRITATMKDLIVIKDNIERFEKYEKLNKETEVID